MPVVRLAHLGEAEKKVLRIALNRSAELAGWDRKLLAVLGCEGLRCLYRKRLRCPEELGMAKKQDDQFSEDKAARRRDEVIRRMAHTPPQHRTSKSPSRQRKAKATAARQAARKRRARSAKT